MMDIGRVCVKIAGRDAGKKCAIIAVLDKNTVMIDGATRRRKCNVSHLEPLPQVIEIAENASTDEVIKALGLPAKEAVKKQKTQKPVTKRAAAIAKKSLKEAVPAKEAATAKKPAKKAAKKE